MSITARIRARIVELAKAAQRRRLLAGCFRADTVRGTPSDGHVPVVVCLWNRPERVGPIVDLLIGQTTGTPIDLHLWNNNHRAREHYRSVVSAVEPAGALASVQLYQAPYNLGSIARFYVARLLAKTGVRGPLIIIDDDQDVQADFVQRALDAYDPASITAWWAFTITGDYYWDRQPAGAG